MNMIVGTPTGLTVKENFADLDVQMFHFIYHFIA